MEPLPPNNIEPPQPSAFGVHPFVQSLRQDVVRFPNPYAEPFIPARCAQPDPGSYQQASASSSLSSIQTPFFFQTHSFEEHDNQWNELPHSFCEDLWSIRFEVLDYEESLMRKVRRMVKERETSLLQKYHEKVDWYHEMVQNVYLSAEGRTVFRRQEDPELWNLQEHIKIAMAYDKDASFLIPGNQLLNLPAFLSVPQVPEMQKLWYRVDPVHRAYICIREASICMPPFLSFSKSEVEGESIWKQGLVYCPYGPESIQLHVNLLNEVQAAESGLPAALPFTGEPGLCWGIKTDQHSQPVQEDVPVSSPPSAPHAPPAPSAPSTTGSAPTPGTLEAPATVPSPVAPAAPPAQPPALQPSLSASSTQASPTAAPGSSLVPSTSSAARSKDSHQAPASQSTSASSVSNKLRAYLELADLTPYLDNAEEAQEEPEDQEDREDREDQGDQGDQQNQQEEQDQQEEQEEQDQQDQQNEQVEQVEQVEDAGAGEVGGAKPLSKREQNELKAKLQADEAKRLKKNDNEALDRYAPLQEVRQHFEEYLKIYSERTLIKRMTFLSFAAPERRDFVGMEDDIVEFFSKDEFVLNSSNKMSSRDKTELLNKLFNNWAKSGIQILEVLSLVLNYLHVSLSPVAKQDLNFLFTTNLSEAALVPVLERYYAHVRAVSRLPPLRSPMEWNLSLVPRDLETFNHGVAEEYVTYLCEHLKRMFFTSYAPTAVNVMTDFEIKVLEHWQETMRTTFSYPPKIVMEVCETKSKRYQASADAKTQLAGKMWGLLSHVNSIYICYYVTCILRAETTGDTTAPLKSPGDVILLCFNFDHRP